jgi:hypothetical protein
VVWTISGIVFNAVGVILLFLFGMPFRERRRGQQYVYLNESDPNQIRMERLHDIFGWIALVIIIAGATMQIAGAINIHAQFVNMTLQVLTAEALSPALATIAAVAAVVWSGGLIVLQIRERPNLVGDGVNFRDSDGVRIPTLSRRLAA